MAMMVNILPLLPDQAAEARRVIYSVANAMFHDRDTLEEAIQYYSDTWPIPDVADFQRSYIENGGAFFAAWFDGKIIGTGAFRFLAEKVCEIKRVWLLPEYHGQGIGYRMMMHLFETAREKGYTLARLETSPVYQPRAYAFYKRLGFYDIPRYGDDPDDVGMELPLVQS